LYWLRHNGPGNARGALNRIRERRALSNLRKSRGKQIADYLANNPIRKLQLGAGSNDLPGWLNSEGFAPSSFTHSLEVASRYILLDVCEMFPFEDRTFDYIFHEHVLEHLDYGQGQFMLRECHRVLKPGGRMRVATPDLQVFIGLYGSQAGPEQREFLNEYVRFNSEVWSTDLAHVRKNHAVFVLNHNLRAWGHQFIYDFDTVADALETTGFAQITRHQPQESQDPNLCGLEFRKELVGIFDALIVEAVKPAALFSS
jgi:predicted SAM-dependent methyltransferase